jgi:hypothetical protein
LRCCNAPGGWTKVSADPNRRIVAATISPQAHHQEIVGKDWLEKRRSCDAYKKDKQRMTSGDYGAPFAACQMNGMTVGE